MAPFALGIVTDVQHADKPDKDVPYMDSTFHRRYSLCLSKLSTAVSHFNETKVARVLHLGDIIDGNETPAATSRDLDQVLSALSCLHAPVSHVLGNHCLELPRAHLAGKLRLPAGPAAYESLDLTPSWRLILLDTMAASLDAPATPQLGELAREHVAARPDAPNSTPYSGGLGPEQTGWLRGELASARAAGFNVIVAGHHPIAQEVVRPFFLAWGAEELMQLVGEFKDTVRAVFSGHYHWGGWAQVDGVHHVVFESVLDSKDEKGSFGNVMLYDNRIEIVGHGDMTSRVLEFQRC